MKFLALITIIASLFSQAVLAADSHKLMIKEPIIRATAPNAGATAGYLTIHNHSQTADRLIAVKAEFARKSEIHEMKMVGDVMKMRPIEGGIIIPAGGMALLEKGGNHLMFMGLTEQIQFKDTYQFTLVFEKAGEIRVNADTISLSGKSHDQKGHKH